MERVVGEVLLCGRIHQGPHMLEWRASREHVERVLQLFLLVCLRAQGAEEILVIEQAPAGGVGVALKCRAVGSEGEQEVLMRRL